MFGRRPKCIGCRGNSAYISPPWASCKKERLCEVIDVSLLARRPGLSRDEYIEICEAVEFCHASASQTMLYVAREPEYFIYQLKALHIYIFGSDESACPGQFRTKRATFGSRRNELEGAPPAEIEGCLFEVHQALNLERLVDLTPRELAAHCAVFMEHFFRIHPFVDGNGRIARLVIQAIAAEAGLMFTDFASTGKDRRKYVKSLQYAHKYVHACGHPDWKPKKDPHRYLAEYLYSHLEAVPPPHEWIEQPPLWLESDSNRLDDFE